MNKYYFVALTKNRKKVKGYLEVSNVEELKKIITYHELLLIKYKKIKKRKKKIIENKLRNKDKISFFKNMESLIDYNKNLIITLDLIKDITKNNLLKKFLDEAKIELYNGNTLSFVMEKYSNIFSKFDIELIYLAEKSNNLKDTFKSLSIYYQNIEKIKNKLITSLIYPTILIVLSVFVFFILMTYIIPLYSNIFNTNNIDIPIYTRLIFKLSEIIVDNIILIIILGLLSLLILVLFVLSKKGKEVLIILISKLPFIRKIYTKVKLYHLATKFSIVLSNKIPISESLSMLISTTSNLYEKRTLSWIEGEIKRGQKLSDAFLSTKSFPKIFIEGVRCGEKSGSLKDQFGYLERIYLEETLTFFNKLSILIEPLSIILISLFVGGIMISIFMPMMGLFNNFN